MRSPRFCASLEGRDEFFETPFTQVKGSNLAVDRTSCTSCSLPPSCLESSDGKAVKISCFHVTALIMKGTAAAAREAGKEGKPAAASVTTDTSFGSRLAE